MVLGIVLLMLGRAAIAFPFSAAVTAELLSDGSLAIVVMPEIAHTCRLRRLSGPIMTLLLGLLTLVTGIERLSRAKKRTKRLVADELVGPLVEYLKQTERA
jgi:hypothetical protein